MLSNPKGSHRLKYKLDTFNFSIQHPKVILEGFVYEFKDKISINDAELSARNRCLHHGDQITDKLFFVIF